MKPEVLDWSTLWLPLVASTAPSPVELGSAKQTFCTRPSAAVATSVRGDGAVEAEGVEPRGEEEVGRAAGGQDRGQVEGEVVERASGNGDGIDWLMVWLVSASRRVSQAREVEGRR